MRTRKSGACNQIASSVAIFVSAWMTQSASADSLEIRGQFGGHSEAIAKQDNLVFVGAGATIVLFDVSDPTAPVELGRTPTLPDQVYDIAPLGDYLLVADGLAGLLVVDIANPAEPRVAGAFDTDMWSLAVATDGAFAYLADWDAGVQVIDVRDPTGPTFVTRLKQGIETATDVAIHDDILVVGHTTGMLLADISDPAAPVTLGQADFSCERTRIALRWPHVFTTSDYAIRVYDISDPVQPELRFNQSVGYVRDLEVSGNLLVNVTGSTYLEFFDASDPSKLIRLGLYLPLGPGAAACLSDGMLALSVSGGGLVVLDVSDPDEPNPLAQVSSLQSVSDFELNGDYVYAVSSQSGLWVIDFAQPSKPIALRSIDLDANSVSFCGNLLAVAEYDGLAIYDLADPERPNQIGWYPAYPLHNVTFIDCELICIVDAPSQLTLIDVSDPTAPYARGAVPVECGVWEVALKDHYLFCAASGCGVRVIDVQDPDAPQLVTTIDYPELQGNAWGVSRSGDILAIAADQGPELYLFDVADPANPEPLAQRDEAGDAWTVALGSGLAFIGMDGGRLLALSVADPRNPKEIASSELTWDAYHMIANGTAPYAATFDRIIALRLSRRADIDCSGEVNVNDIDPFVMALISRDDYESQYPDCNWLNGDIDESGAVDFNDIDGFVECLINGGCE